ncbi:MAG: apolipoprotein N-acyltransferase [Candidatus Omnitrophota bacterium]
MKKKFIIEAAPALFSGVLLALSFSFGWCWPLAWFGFAPLLIALDKQSAKKAFLLSYLAGLLFWLGTIYWLVHVTLPGQIILSCYLALYFGVFGFLLSVFRLPSSASLIFIPSLWVILEYLRGYLFTGFPWALLGYSQYANLPAIQIADTGGVWIVSFLVMMVNAGVARRKNLWLAALFLIPCLVYGYYKLYALPENGRRPPLRIAVIQGNIPQSLKWDAGAREPVMQRYFGLTAEAKKDDPDLIVWPEAALPVILEEEPLYYARLKNYAKNTGSPLLFGAVTARGGLYYNSALLLAKGGQFSARHDKLHLVPFGEYIPFRSIFPFLDTIAPIGDITRGSRYTLFNIRQRRSGVPYQFGVLICFEDVFPALSRGFVNKGADFLINITNDAWFGKTSEPGQHLAASVFRAIENRVNLVRSANTGISCFINPRGRVAYLEDARGERIFIPGYSTREISPVHQPTLYGRYGDFFAAACLLCVLCIALFSLCGIKARKIFLVSLAALLCYAAFRHYQADKYYFLPPVNYNGDLVIRNDLRGKGFFAASRYGRRIHQGVDLFAEMGAPVLAARSGKVVAARHNRGMGNYAVIRHRGNLTTVYAHLARLAVARGQIVRQGDLIGSVGKTGNANHPGVHAHLHFEIRKNGIPQDPLEYLQGNV